MDKTVSRPWSWLVDDPSWEQEFDFTRKIRRITHYVSRFGYRVKDFEIEVEFVNNGPDIEQYVIERYDREKLGFKYNGPEMTTTDNSRFFGTTMIGGGNTTFTMASTSIFMPGSSFGDARGGYVDAGYVVEEQKPKVTTAKQFSDYLKKAPTHRTAFLDFGNEPEVQAPKTKPAKLDIGES